MNVISPTVTGPLYRSFKYLNRHYLSISVPLLWSFEENTLHLESEQNLWDLFAQESEGVFANDTLDFILPKDQAEFIVNGYGYGVYSQDGRTAVSISLNNVKKDLWVTGERYWIDGKITKALPFERIAISWANAYGGSDFAENIMGKGRQPITIDNLRYTPLPNIEDPHDPVYKQGQPYSVAGYAALPFETPLRDGLLGTYEQHWRDNDFPGFAEDISWSYFNQSPKDQRLNRLEPGDVATFTHLHPEKATLSLTIPPLKVRLFIQERDGENLNSADTKLMTCWALPHLEKAFLVYQTFIEIPDEDYERHLEHLMVCIEHAAHERSDEHYLKVFDVRTSEHDSYYAEVDSQLVDPLFLSKHKEESKDDALLANRLARLDATITELEHKISESFPDKLSPNKAEQATEVDYLPDDFSSEEQVDRYVQSLEKESFWTMLRERRKHHKTIQSVREQTASLQGSTTHYETTESLQQQFLQQLDETQRSKHYKEVTQPEKILNQQWQSLQSQYDAKNRQFFEQHFAKRKARFAVEQLPVPTGTHLSSLYDCPLREETERHFYYLSDQCYESESYHDRTFISLRLTSIRFMSCDFSDSRFYRVIFEHCRFENCVFNRCDFERSRFIECTFIDCHFSEFENDKMVILRSQFNRCHLSSWLHQRTSIHETTFHEVSFADCDFEQLTAIKLRFTDCEFSSCALSMVHFDGLDFNRCRGETLSLEASKPSRRLRLVECRIDEFSCRPHTQVKEVEVLQARLHRSSLNQVQLESFQFIDVDFSDTDWVDSKLTQGLIKNCAMIENDLSYAYLEQIRCITTDCRESDFNHVSFRHSSFKDVSFFLAELSMVDTDAYSQFEACYYKNANFVPRLQH